MALTIGRAGKTLALPDPSKWSADNGLVTLAGYFQTSPITDAMRLRDQLLGYQENWDEPVVPVIVDSETRLTGFYRVLGVRITTDLEALAVGFLGYEVALQPVWGYAQPLFESVITGALLTNAVGAVLSDVDQFHAFPTNATEYYRGAAPGTATRATETGASDITFNVNGSISDTASFSMAPTDFYIGSCLIEQGSSLQPVTGRLLAVADAINWRLSNGMVRVTISSGGVLSVSHWSGGAWQTAKQYAIGVASLNPAIAPVSLTILRNSTEECAVRLGMTTGTFGVFGNYGRVSLDISLRRGDRIARCYLALDVAQPVQVKLVTIEAATAITYGAVTTGGIRATANDATGNRYVLLSYQAATTSDLVNGKLSLNALSKTMDIGFGCEIGGSGSTGQSTAVNIAKQYLAAQTETQRIVAR